MDNLGWFALFANYAKTVISRIPLWNTAYDKHAVSLTIGTSEDGSPELIMTAQDGTELKAPISALKIKPEGLEAPLGVVTFNEVTNVATVTEQFTFNAYINGVLQTVKTPLAPNNTIQLTEKGVYSRIDLVTYVVATSSIGFVEGPVSDIEIPYPDTPAGQIKLAEIYRPVGAENSTVIPVQISEFYSTTNGAHLNREVVILNGKNTHRRASPARPLDPGDDIYEDVNGNELFRFIPDVTTGVFQFRYGGDDTNRDCFVGRKHFEDIPFVDATGVETIDLMINDRLAKFPKQSIKVVRIEGTKQINVNDFGVEYDTEINTLTIDGVMGTGFIRLY